VQTFNKRKLFIFYIFTKDNVLEISDLKKIVYRLIYHVLTKIKIFSSLCAFFSLMYDFLYTETKQTGMVRK